MYFIEVLSGFDIHDGYVAFTLDKVKEVMAAIFDELDLCESHVEGKEPTNWSALNSELESLTDIEDIFSVIEGFREGTNVSFHFFDFEEGEALGLNS